MKKFHLELGDPVVVGQGRLNEANGNYCFPGMCFTDSGSIAVSWAMSPDDEDSYTGPVGSAESDDGGKTWHARNPKNLAMSNILMDNGRYFRGFEAKNAYVVDYMDSYTPALRTSTVAHTQVELYYADDIKELDRSVTGIEYDPVTKTTNTFPVTVKWPYQPLLVLNGNKVYPPSQVLALHAGYGTIKMDGVLYYATYCRGFDSKTGEVMPYSKVFSVFVLRSTDNGRTWEYHSQISVSDAEYKDEPTFDGFCEPMMAQMQDGSVIMLIRTGNGQCSYIARSEDQCKTWSHPKVFDKVGVLPQLLRLNCGVTLSTYGRPGLFARATSDPSGLVWEDPVILLNYTGMWDSCYYTNMLPLSDDTALVVYSDRYYPNTDGVKVKTILARTIRVVFDS